MDWKAYSDLAASRIYGWGLALEFVQRPGDGEALVS